MDDVKIPAADFEQLFRNLSSLRVAVIGDVMLDTYWWGNLERISPEGPVPVVALHKKENRIGGAANIALNTISLGAETTLFSVTGEDEEAETLLNLLQNERIDTKYILRSPERITTNKIRIISKNQQMLRVDSEVTHNISGEDEEKLLSNFTGYVKRYQPAVVIFGDYNIGTLSHSLISAVIAICKEYDIATAADPKRKNFLAYKEINIFKPGLKETGEYLNLASTAATEENLRQIHHRLYEELHHRISLITLPDYGLFFQKGNYAKIVPAHISDIVDASGASDTIMAVASLIYATTKDITLTAAIANIAGGIVCKNVGTIAISRQLLLAECRQLLCSEVV